METSIDWDTSDHFQGAQISDQYSNVNESALFLLIQQNVQARPYALEKVSSLQRDGKAQSYTTRNIVS